MIFIINSGRGENNQVGILWDREVRPCAISSQLKGPATHKPQSMVLDTHTIFRVLKQIFPSPGCPYTIFSFRRGWGLGMWCQHSSPHSNYFSLLIYPFIYIFELHILRTIFQVLIQHMKGPTGREKWLSSHFRGMMTRRASNHARRGVCQLLWKQQ